MQAVSMLASEIAHEINNPLHYISNYLYLLSTEVPKDLSGYEYIQKIQNGVDALAGIMRALLDFSRPPHDPFVPTDICSMVNDARTLSDADLAAKNIQIENLLSGSCPQVLGSARNLVQVFQHILNNACEALSPGGTIGIEAFGEGSQAVVRFRDTGCGIPKENLGRVFDPFFTTKTHRKGAGLGLAICYNIVKHHKGNIAIESTPGKGTTVTITIPSIS